MKSFLISLLFAPSVLASLPDRVATKYLEVEDLNRWHVMNHHSEIYDPLFSASDGMSAAHSVHVSDRKGKYLKLDYSMNHPAEASFLKLEHSEHSSRVKSITCASDDTITLHFADASTTRSYKADVELELSKTSEYFLVGSHMWKCLDYRINKYYPVMRRISSISSFDEDEHELVLHTERASYLDVFENLQMKFETNMKMSHENMDTYKQAASKLGGGSGSKRQHGKKANHQNRKLLSWLSDAWDDVVDGVEDLVDDIEEGVEELVEDIVDVADEIVDDVETVWDVLTGQNVTFGNSTDYAWSYNYDSTNDNASSTFYLDDSNEVNCINCYAFFDLVYTYEVEINDRQLYRLYMVGDGEAKINVEIEMEVSWSYEYDIDTPDIPIPYLSVDVFGIAFGFVIYGELGVGVYIAMDYIHVGAMAYGSLSRGISYWGPETKYAQSTTNGSMQYIADESFDHTLTGPELEFSSANITFYLKPTLYLELTYVGSVYFGIQPEIELSLTKDEATNVSTDCAIDFIPTAKLLAFVGAQIDPLDLGTVWKKEISLTVVQFVITTLEGCITQAELTKIETYIHELEEDLGLARRMVDSDGNSFKNFHLDYTSVTTERYSNAFRWGKTGTEWWGNLTTLNISGNASDEMADYGRLLIKVREKHGQNLTGIYVTEVYDWYLPPLNENDFGYITNVSCIARLEFNKKENATYDGVFEYEANTLEYWCDVNDTYLFAGNEALRETFLSKITLSGDFYVLMMDTHFHSGFLFDLNYDHLFALSRKRKHDTSANVSLATAQIGQGWFGEYHCKNGSTVSVTCYFQDYDPVSGNVSAVLQSGGEHYWLYGTMSFDENRLELMTQDKTRVSLSGFMTLYSDGTILYTGPALTEDSACTGFVLQGYMDTSQFDVEYDYVSKDDAVDPTTIIDGSRFATGMFYGGLIGVALVSGIVGIVYGVLRYKGYAFCTKRDKPVGYSMMDEQL